MAQGDGYSSESGIMERDTNLVPEEVSFKIIQDAPKSSAALALGNVRPMTTKKSRTMLLDSLPNAYFVNGDTGLKQTTGMGWGPLWMEAEPIAALVVIPDDYADDAGLDLWGEIAPRVSEAIGKTLDGAVFWGINKPATWTADHLYNGAIVAGNYVVEGTSIDDDIAALAESLGEDGTTVNGFATKPAMKWKMARLKTIDGMPIFTRDLQSPVPDRLYGYPFREVENGSWDPTLATMIMGDWSKLYVGVRSDIRYTIHADAVITNEEGTVIFNSMQQDSKIMRVVARYGFTVADPTTSLADRPYPFGAVLPASYTYSS
jgi:HK97 family phage major capsid protein